MEKRYLTHEDCAIASGLLYAQAKTLVGSPCFRIYGVPRGGIPVAYLVQRFHPGCIVVGDVSAAELIVDDIVDSGATMQRYAGLRAVPFLALTDYLEPSHKKGQWVVFPWEQGDRDASADDFVIRLLQYVGEDPDREGLKETPARVLKAWKEWTAGYGVDPASVMKVFEDGSENYDEMVVVKDLPFYSHCEHHLAPFFGTATVAYVPSRKILGLSKLGRVLEVFARRLQVQERLTSQVADALQQSLDPKGVAVMVKARHLCMESRGYSRQGHVTITSALRGVFLKEDKARAEFLSIAS